MRNGSPQEYRDLFDNGIIYRDSDLTMTDSPDENVTYLQTNDYERGGTENGGHVRTHTFFSSYPPDSILKSLTDKLRDAGQEWKVKPPTWKINFEVQKQVNRAEENYSDSRNMSVHNI